MNDQYEFLTGLVGSVLFFISGWQDRGFGPGSRYIGLFSQSIAVLIALGFALYAFTHGRLIGSIVLSLVCIGELWFIRRAYWRSKDLNEDQ
jgi:hypothetical protein